MSTNNQNRLLILASSSVVHVGALALLIGMTPHLPVTAEAGAPPVTIAIATEAMMQPDIPEEPPPPEEVQEEEITEAVLASTAADAPVVEDPLPTLTETVEAAEVAEVLPPPPPAPPPPRPQRPRVQRTQPAPVQQVVAAQPAAAPAPPAPVVAPPGPPPSYLGRLQAWLERHKDYPPQARQQRQQGTALLRFVMDRSGRVTRYDIVRSSGYQLLDSEVTNMIQRASPLPALPAEMNLSQLELTVPVRFNLR